MFSSSRYLFLSEPIFIPKPWGQEMVYSKEKEGAAKMRTVNKVVISSYSLDIIHYSKTVRNNKSKATPYF